MNISIIIPIYNEENAVKSTIESIIPFAQHSKGEVNIILVNDGSTDNTSSILQEYSHLDFILIIDRKNNQGYGYSIKEGVLATNAEKILIADADGSYPIDLIPKFINNYKEKDMVIGERTGKKVNIGKFNLIAKFILKTVIYILTSVWIKDINSGFRIFKKSLIIKYWFLIPDGFSLTTTLTVSALIDGGNVKFIPINYNKRIGKSKIRPVRDFSNFLLLIFRIINFFNPLKFYIPISVLFLILASARSIRDIYIVNSIGSLAIMLFLVSIQAFFFGLIADLIVKKTSFLINSRKNNNSSI